MDALLARGSRRGPIGFLVGAYAVVWGLGRIVNDRRLRGLMLWPLLITGVFYLASIVLLIIYGDDLLGLLWQPPSSGWLLVVWWLGAIVMVVAGLLILVLLFSTVAEAIGGPFYDKMAIRVLEGHDIPTREPGFFEGTVPDLFRSLLFVFATISFGLFGLIPVVGIIFVALSTMVAWLGFASGAVNPALLVTDYRLSDRLRWLREHLSTSLGLGAVVAAAMLMPFIGLLALPSSIVGASELHAQDHLRGAVPPRRRRE